MIEAKSLFEAVVDPVQVVDVTNASATVFKLASHNSDRLFSE
jgi:hypothetical protein